MDLFMNKKRNCVEIVLYKKKIINLLYKRVTYKNKLTVFFNYKNRFSL